MKAFGVAAVVVLGLAGTVRAIESGSEQVPVECILQEHQSGDRPEQNAGVSDDHMVQTMADQIGYFALGPGHEPPPAANASDQERASLEAATDSKACSDPKNNS